ncbi:MAG: hypothetical protein ABI273_09710 [Lacunisphaera sp.]
MNPMTPEELEKFIDRQLRDLPSHRAPVSLESRVLAAIERQAGIPWYHKSWSYWPAFVRLAFLVLAIGATAGFVAAFYFGFNDVNASGVVAQAGEKLSFFTQLYQVATWIAGLGAQVVSSIPSIWLYGAAALVAALYGTFLGIGAAAYRVLYRNN